MIGMASFQTLIFPAGFFSHFRLWGKKVYLNCISLQNNIEAELKFFSSFETFYAKKKRGGKPQWGFFPHKVKLKKNLAGFHQRVTINFIND